MGRWLWWFAPGCVALVTSGAALSWDGSEFLFRTLHEGQPTVLWSRWTMGLLQLPALALGRVAGVGAGVLAFGAALVAVPALSLGATWWLTRRARSELVVWAALGIGVVTLPGQLFLVSEGAMAAQLAWPLLTLVIVARGPGAVAGGIGLVLAMIWLHPVSSVLLAAVAVAGVLAAGGRPRGAGTFVVVTCVLGALARWAAPVSAYEESLAERAVLEFQARRTILDAGLLPAAVLVAVAVALVVWSTRRGPGARLLPVSAVLLLAAGIPLLAWAADSSAWSAAYDYRGIAALATAVILVGAGWSMRREPDVAWMLSARLVIGAAGLVFSATLLVQGWSWWELRRSFEAEVVATDAPCVPSEQLPSVDRGDPTVEGDGNALDHWATAPLSVLAQGRAPETVVLAAGCDRPGFVWYPPEPEPVGEGWFDLPER